MKITFLTPPSKEKDKVPERIYGCSYQIYQQPNLPLLYVAGILQNQRHELDLIDFTYENNSQGALEKFLLNSRSQVYIIHSVLLSKKIDLDTSKVINKIKPNAFVIFFGPEPTRVPEEYLSHRNFIVIRGEPEIIAKNLIEVLEKKLPLEDIKGISYLKNDRQQDNETFGIIENPDILPFPARNLVKKYEGKFYNTKIPSQPHTLILTSRGCAFRCYFCVPNSISWARELEWKKYHNGQKPPLALRSAQNIITEFKQLKNDGYKSVWVMDDMFLWGKERILEISKGIKDLNLEIGILARIDSIDEDIAKALKEAGCRIIDFGVESFNQEILDYIKKDIKSEQIKPAIEIVKRCNMIPEINLMMGVCPLETKQNIKDSIKKAIELDVKYVLFSIATPFPGTELEKVAKEKGWIIEEKYKNLTENLDPANKALMTMPNLSAEDLEKLLKNLGFCFPKRDKKLCPCKIPRRKWPKLTTRKAVLNCLTNQKLSEKK